MLTPRERELRRKYLGASDAPAILGVSPWSTPADVYWSKVEPEVGQRDTDATRTGQRLERALLDFAQERMEIGHRITTRNRFRVAPDRICSCTLDAEVTGQHQIVEAKYVGPTLAEQWGQDGTDEVPDYVLVQVAHQMHVTGFELAWIPALIIRYQPEWCLYKVPRNDDFIRDVVEAETEFWHRHIVPQVPPDGCPPPLAVLKARHREPNKVIEVVPELLLNYASACTAAKLIDERKAESLQALLAAMDDAEGATWGDPEQMLTYLEQKSSPRVDLDRLRDDGLWDKYVTQGTHRVARIVKRKES